MAAEWTDAEGRTWDPFAKFRVSDPQDEPLVSLEDERDFEAWDYFTALAEQGPPFDPDYDAVVAETTNR